MAWLDALSRKRAGDYKTFEDLIVAPIRREVFELVWTHERYTCHGVPVHSPLYYEYPEVLATITRDVRFGLSFGLGTFSLDPFLDAAAGESSFAWSIGDVSVEYNTPSHACFALPMEWPHGLEVTVTGLKDSAIYGYNSTGGSGATKADANGTVLLWVHPAAGTTTCLVRQTPARVKSDDREGNWPIVCWDNGSSVSCGGQEQQCGPPFSAHDGPSFHIRDASCGLNDREDIRNPPPQNDARDASHRCMWLQPMVLSSTKFMGSTTSSIKTIWR